MLHAPIAGQAKATLQGVVGFLGNKGCLRARPWCNIFWFYRVERERSCGTVEMLDYPSDPVHGGCSNMPASGGGLGIVSNGLEDNTMADEDLKAEIEKLRAENETLKRSTTKELFMKVSEKGGVSVYGLGRFPVTLYKEQWLRLLETSDAIHDFIKENDSQLKSKSQ